MIENIIKSIFGDTSEKKVKAYLKSVSIINSHFESYKDMNLDDVKAKTLEFKSLFSGLDFRKTEDMKKINDLLNGIKFEAFALVKQACSLLNGQSFELKDGKVFEWNMIPYDVQLVGGLGLHDGNISEMRTGEGKTLVATLPAYLNTLSGNPVHIVTVNDYLAARDAEEMGILYNALGLSVGVITHNQDKITKKENYKKDVVYATNNELGFDYLRDNMISELENKSQSPLFFAIIDEVDSILIDEARTPLIISMPDNEPITKYTKFATIAKMLEAGVDYKIDEKGKNATLTEAGITKIEGLLKVENIYMSNHYNDLHHIENAIKAMGVYKKDKDYLVVEGEVLIIDEHTGRVLAGRRYSEGLHQAIEAKEQVEIKQESKTLASITFQNYFRMYAKLSGMTGTAKTEEEEFYKVYGLEVLVIPTNKPIARIDLPDLLFKNEKGKFEYIINIIEEIHKTEQPVLVGTVSVDKSEYLSNELAKRNIKHNVLNAKQHEKEAEIIASAGQRGAITIATNMAGRGTDIKLGEGVKELGGLYIIGSEKHETRRIDNQLRGRAGRQGDPGTTQFLVSPNDDIMRIFGGDKLFSAFNSPIFASLPDNEPLIQSGMLTKRITSVQKQVEGHHFDTRKHVLQYDDVMNKHREIIYSRRNKILEENNAEELVFDMIKNQIGKIIKNNTRNNGLDIQKITSDFNSIFEKEIISENQYTSQDIEDILYKIAIGEYENIKSKADREDIFLNIEKKIVLSSIDELWMSHIDSMSKLKDSVAFEGYAQRDPLVVYKEKAYEKFVSLLSDIEYKVIKSVYFMDKNTVVEEIKIDENDLEINEDTIENIINSSISENPLLNNNIGNKKENVVVSKSKIRI